MAVATQMHQTEAWSTSVRQQKYRLAVQTAEGPFDSWARKAALWNPQSAGHLKMHFWRLLAPLNFSTELY